MKSTLDQAIAQQKRVISCYIYEQAEPRPDTGYYTIEQIISLKNWSYARLRKMRHEKIQQQRKAGGGKWITQREI